MYVSTKSATISGIWIREPNNKSLVNEVVTPTKSDYRGVLTDNVVFNSLPKGSLWVRIYAQDGRSDSVRYKINNDATRTLWISSKLPYQTWGWVKIAESFNGGSLYFYSREADVKIDIIAILPQGQVPTDEDAILELTDSPVPPQPIKKDWTLGKMGIAWPMEGHGTRNSLLYDWYYNWGSTASLVNDPKYVPMQWGTTVSKNIQKLNDGRPLLLLNEPDVSSAYSSHLSPQKAAETIHEAVNTLNWKGPIYGIGTLSHNLIYLENVIANYENNYGAWPLDGWHIHVYSQVRVKPTYQNPTAWTTKSAADIAIADVLKFINKFGGPVIVSELGGLRESIEWAKPEKWEMLRLYESLIRSLIKIPEVIAFAPFSVAYYDFPDNDHTFNDKYPNILNGKVTELGAQHNRIYAELHK